MLDGKWTLILEEQPHDCASTLEIRADDVIEDGKVVGKVRIDGEKAVVDYESGINNRSQAHRTQIKLERQDDMSFHVLMLTEIDGELAMAEYGSLTRQSVLV